jgi:hypothetical protein
MLLLVSSLFIVPTVVLCQLVAGDQFGWRPAFALTGGLLSFIAMTQGALS